MTQRRIRNELKEWKEKPLSCAQITAVPDDYKRWDILYYAPDDTPYETGVFKIQITFPNDYAFKPPDIRFKTKIYHINVTRQGKVCLPEILDEWSPQYTMKDVIGWLDDLIVNPARDGTITNDEMIVEFIDDREAYDQKAAEWTKTYAIPDCNNCKDEAKKEDEKQPDINDVIGGSGGDMAHLSKIDDVDISNDNDHDQIKQELETQNVSNLQIISKKK